MAGWRSSAVETGSALVEQVTAVGRNLRLGISQLTTTLAELLRRLTGIDRRLYFGDLKRTGSPAIR